MGVARSNMQPMGFEKLWSEDSTSGKPLMLSLPSGEVLLIQTLTPDGRTMSDDEALAAWQSSRQSLGSFSSPEEAAAFSKLMAMHSTPAPEGALRGL